MIFGTAHLEDIKEVSNISELLSKAIPDAIGSEYETLSRLADLEAKIVVLEEERRDYIDALNQLKDQLSRAERKVVRMDVILAKRKPEEGPERSEAKSALEAGTPNDSSQSVELESCRALSNVRLENLQKTAEECSQLRGEVSRMEELVFIRSFYMMSRRLDAFPMNIGRIHVAFQSSERIFLY